MKKLELLAPVGDKERLIAAVHFGCDPSLELVAHLFY